jgi:hypothetical protein
MALLLSIAGTVYVELLYAFFLTAHFATLPLPTVLPVFPRPLNHSYLISLRCVFYFVF